MSRIILAFGLCLLALPPVARAQPQALAQIERASAALMQQHGLAPLPPAALLGSFKRSIAWQDPRSHTAAQFRTALNEALTEFWRNPSAGLARDVAAQRFLVVLPGCGTQCQVLLLVDLVDGVALNPDITTGLGAAFTLDNTALIVDPPSAIREAIGPQGLATPVEAAGYVIAPNGSMRRSFVIPMR